MDRIPRVRTLRWVLGGFLLALVAGNAIGPTLAPVAQGLVVPETELAVQAGVGGRVVSVEVPQGALVNEDTVVARIAADALRDRVDELRADLEVTDASLTEAMAQSRHARAEARVFARLAEAGEATYQDVQRKQALVEQLHAREAILRAERGALETRLNGAERRLAGEDVIARITGTVTTPIDSLRNRLVQPADTIFTVASGKVIECSVNERWAARIQEGKQLVVEFPALPGVTASATIREVLPMATGDSSDLSSEDRHAIVILETDLPETVRWGMSCHCFVPASVRWANTRLGGFINSIGRRIVGHNKLAD